MLISKHFAYSASCLEYSRAALVEACGHIGASIQRVAQTTWLLGLQLLISVVTPANTLAGVIAPKVVSLVASTTTKEAQVFLIE